ncbi:MAG: hypothetical protein HXO52_02605 [Prevotella sp.]|nr:hypothetical protein [Prevotella sp.]
MERGVNSVIYKQKRRLFTSRKRPLRMEETPSSKQRRRLFVFTPAVPANEALHRYTPTCRPLAGFR